MIIGALLSGLALYLVCLVLWAMVEKCGKALRGWLG
jgi:hypothetical protein